MFAEKIAEFKAKFPKNVDLVEAVPFKKKIESSKNTSLRNVLIISSNGLNRRGKNRLLDEYKKFIKGDFISFSIWERTTHLFLQKDGKFFDFGFWVIPYWFGKELKTKLYRFRQRKIKYPNSRRLEPVIAITKEEKANLEIYLKNLKSGYKRILGKYYDPGCQFTNAQLNDNQAKPGHNCTSWITTAPIGNNRECLIELLGTDRAHEIGTNPGWWAHWILYAASPERLPLVIYWSPDPLEKISSEQVNQNKVLSWDFNRV